MPRDYWLETIACSFEENGITATEEQIKAVAADVEISHENYGTYTGEDCIPNPQLAEIENLKKELRKEQDMVTCLECNGSGSITTYGGTFQSTSSCWRCRGRGRGPR